MSIRFVQILRHALFVGRAGDMSIHYALILRHAFAMPILDA